MTRSLFVRPLAPWLLACLLFALLAPAIILNNFHFLFRTNLYEFQDLAADSLQILKAKGWGELYGQYSRWGFHHPGPAFFYVQAAGESVFFDWTHVVPRPLNAQMLATALLNACFLSAGLATAAHWVGARTVFLPLALALGLLHVANISFYGPEFSPLFLIGNWPACFLVIPFGMMLLVLASVGAGRGESLPWAVLIGGFLAHGHITQAALFVPPLCLLAYTGLVLACRRPALWLAGGTGGAQSVPRWPWQVFPRAHLVAAGLLAVFALPLLLDLARGSQSNLARILAFRRSHAAEAHKPLLTSLLYFLQFGAYQWFRPKTSGFGDYTTHEILKYLTNTRVVWEFWVVGTLGTLVTMASWIRRRNAIVETALDEIAVRTRARRRYIVHLVILTSAAIMMTLVWGVVMNGEMFYLNAYFNFSIFYVGMLVIAAVAADALCAVAAPEWSGRGLRGFLYAAVVVFAAFNAAPLRSKQYAQDVGLRIVADNVAGALRVDPPKAPRARYLVFYPQDNALAVQMALLLERAGYTYYAAKDWEIVLGAEHCPLEPVQPRQVANGRLPFYCWRIVPATDVPPGIAAQPLVGGNVLLTGLEWIDPTSASEIRFGGPDGNDVAFTTIGWPEPERTGSAYRLTGARECMLNFRAKPVSAESSVRVVFDIAPFLLPGKKPVQRIGVNFNGIELGNWSRTSGEPLEVTIPASAWNAREEAWLLLRFPDAATPASLGFNTDSRTVAFAFHRIGFQVGPRPASP